MNKLWIAKDERGRPLEVIPVSDCRQAVVLAAGETKILATPTGATMVLINATSNVWVRFGGAAAVPTADITDGSAPELNPGPRYIKGCSSIGFAAAQPCKVAISFYRGDDAL